MSVDHALAVLLVADSDEDAALETVALGHAGYEVRSRRVHDAAGMTLALAEEQWDVVLCDHVLPNFDSLAALGVLSASGCDIPLIVVSGAVGEEAAVAAIRNGAADFVSKSHLSRLAPVVRTHMHDGELHAAQRRAEAQFRSAFDDAPFGSALITLGPGAGRILRVNRALCEATELSRRRLVGMQIQELLHPDERSRFDQGLNSVLEGGRHTRRAETRLINAAGSESWFLFSLSYVRAPGGHDAIAHFVDIDARKRVEEALQLAHAQALEASRMKSEFVVNMSHELRTPLNGVVGLAGLLADTSLTADQSAYVAGIRSSGQSLMGVIGGILDFSKIEAGALTIDAADFEPAEVVAEVCALLAPTVSEKVLQLIVSVDAAVPDLAHADSGRIRQVLTNLAGNAVKFTDAGKIVVRLGLQHGEPNQLRFDVTDAGPGIAADARPFEPFWQADSSTTRHRGGTGLGLAIAERMVELMGGRLSFENAPGGGSHFWFTVPYEDALSTHEPVLGLVGARALVADENANRRSIVERLLASFGMRVTGVDGAVALLAELQSARDRGDPYDVAALDQRLAQIDGASAAEAVRLTASPATRVLLLGVTPRSARPAEAAAADGSLSEPFGRARLAVEMVRVLGLTSSAASASPLHRPGRLLLVEDDPINQLFAVNLLKREGWGVEVAADGAEAVELARAGGYDAILMDCQMPKLDGYAATEAIRRLEGPGFHTPIIAVTAHATAYDRQRCLVAGMDAYVAKPFTTAELHDALRRELECRPRTRATSPSPRPHGHARQRGLPAVLDTGRLAHISMAMRARLIDMFTESSRERIAALKDAVAAGDTATVAALAHTLKGASATIGAQRMDRACERLGKAVGRGRSGQLAARQDDLESAFALTTAALADSSRGAADG